MKVILLDDVSKLGKKYDEKEVADGYARNFLIPKGIAKPLTEETMKWAQEQRETFAAQAEEELKDAQALVARVDGLELEIEVKLNKSGKPYAAVTPTKISQKLKEREFDVKKEQIVLKGGIKELGEHKVKLSFPHNLEAEITLNIVGEGKEEAEEEDI